MKKFCLVLLVFVACILTFAGCSNEPKEVKVINYPQTYPQTITEYYLYDVSGTYNGSTVPTGKIASVTKEQQNGIVSYRVSYPGMNLTMYKEKIYMQISNDLVEVTSCFNKVDITDGNSFTFTYSSSSSSSTSSSSSGTANLTFTKK